MHRGRDRTRRRVLVGAILATLFVALAAGVSQSSTGSKTAIPAAPVFSASDLAAPNGNWATNGGSTMNQRYSPLTQITAANIKNLKGVWRTHLKKSGVAAKYSGE